MIKSSSIRKKGRLDQDYYFEDPLNGVFIIADGYWQKGHLASKKAVENISKDLKAFDIFAKAMKENSLPLRIVSSDFLEDLVYPQSSISQSSKGNSTLEDTVLNNLEETNRKIGDIFSKFKLWKKSQLDKKNKHLIHEIFFEELEDRDPKNAYYYTKDYLKFLRRVDPSLDEYYFVRILAEIMKELNKKAAYSFIKEAKKRNFWRSRTKTKLIDIKEKAVDSYLESLKNYDKFYGEILLEFLSGAIDRTNKEIYEDFEKDVKKEMNKKEIKGLIKKNMIGIEEIKKGQKRATTLDVAVLKNDKLYIKHVGDSKIYVSKKDRTLEQLTHDCEKNPYGGLMNAIGNKKGVEKDGAVYSTKDFNSILLVTDGVTNCVATKEEIKNILIEKEPEKIIHALDNLAENPTGIAKLKNALPEKIKFGDDITAIAINPNYKEKSIVERVERGPISAITRKYIPYIPYMDGVAKKYGDIPAIGRLTKILQGKHRKNGKRVWGWSDRAKTLEEAIKSEDFLLETEQRGEIMDGVKSNKYLKKKYGKDLIDKLDDILKTKPKPEIKKGKKKEEDRELESVKSELSQYKKREKEFKKYESKKEHYQNLEKENKQLKEKLKERNKQFEEVETKVDEIEKNIKEYRKDTKKYIERKTTEIKEHLTTVVKGEVEKKSKNLEEVLKEETRKIGDQSKKGVEESKKGVEELGKRYEEKYKEQEKRHGEELTNLKKSYEAKEKGEYEKRIDEKKIKETERPSLYQRFTRRITKKVLPLVVAGSLFFGALGGYLANKKKNTSMISALQNRVAQTEVQLQEERNAYKNSYKNLEQKAIVAEKKYLQAVQTVESVKKDVKYIKQTVAGYGQDIKEVEKSISKYGSEVKGIKEDVKEIKDKSSYEEKIESYGQRPEKLETESIKKLVEPVVEKEKSHGFFHRFTNACRQEKRQEEIKKLENFTSPFENQKIYRAEKNLLEGKITVYSKYPVIDIWKDGKIMLGEKERFAVHNEAVGSDVGQLLADANDYKQKICVYDRSKDGKADTFVLYSYKKLEGGFIKGPQIYRSGTNLMFR